jgi:M3 family oligoendopeptidase
MEKFKDLQYVRPSAETTEAALKEQLSVFRSAASYEDAKAAFLKRQDIIAEFRTMQVIASIRSNMNTADEFYRAEEDYFNTVTPKLSVVLKTFNEAVAEGRFRAEFEKEYGEQLFRLLDADIRTNSEEIVSEKIEEAKISSDYMRTAASCRTMFRGEECNFYGLLKHMLSTDRDERKEAMIAWADLYESASADLEDQYAKLCALRRREAEKLGFDNYIEMVYLSRHRFDYTAADIEKFREAVRTYIVPAAVEIHEAQRKRLGVEKLEYYDEQLAFPQGNSTPDKDTQGMVDAAQKMYRELSPETGEFFDFMVGHELFDLETRPNKHLGGYCTSLMKYKAPFIFSNFNGSSADTEVLTHEAGHAFEGYVASRVQELAEYRHSTSEINEIHSMGMEFFTDPWYSLFYPEGEGDRYRYEHLADSLENITYLVSVDEFQHRVFEGEQPDAAGLRKIWKDIENKYMPWRSYDGNEFLESGGFWMQKQHIFLYPFYYVDYALAMLCALQFFLRMRRDRKEAWDSYLKLCRLGGSLGYFDLLQAAGLNNPFREETVRDVTSGVKEVLAELEKNI